MGVSMATWTQRDSPKRGRGGVTDSRGSGVYQASARWCGVEDLISDCADDSERKQSVLMSKTNGLLFLPPCTPDLTLTRLYYHEGQNQMSCLVSFGDVLEVLFLLVRTGLIIKGPRGECSHTGSFMIFKTWCYRGVKNAQYIAVLSCCDAWSVLWSLYWGLFCWNKLHSPTVIRAWATENMRSPENQ